LISYQHRLPKLRFIRIYPSAEAGEALAVILRNFSDGKKIKTFQKKNEGAMICSNPKISTLTDQKVLTWS